MAIRIQVFVEEQGVPLEEERDADDAGAFHVLGINGAGEAVATGRLVVRGAAAKLGRVAVRREARGAGWGRRVMEALEAEARRRGLAEAVLDAQLPALPFYAGLGYVAEGPVFLDAGIEHRLMRKPLGPGATVGPRE